MSTSYARAALNVEAIADGLLGGFTAAPRDGAEPVALEIATTGGVGVSHRNYCADRARSRLRLGGGRHRRPARRAG